MLENNDTQYKRDADESMVTDRLEQSPLLRPERVDKAVMFQGLHISQQVQNPTTAPNDRLDSSDAEDLISQSQIHPLNPMGIDAQAEVNEYVDKRIISSREAVMLRGKKRNEPAQTDFSSKCQVYSIYDEQSSVKKNAHQESRLDGVSSDPVLENSKVIE